MNSRVQFRVPETELMPDPQGCPWKLLKGLSFRKYLLCADKGLGPGATKTKEVVPTFKDLESAMD